MALATRGDVFRTGTSIAGLSDLELFAKHTHKLESRYLDSLVAPSGADQARLLRLRSPIHYRDRLRTPMLILQGLEDTIVPPEQATLMVHALKKKGVPVAYLPFKGEGHMFRKARTWRRALEAELYFYGRILGFTPADRLEPIPIHNLN